MRCSLVVLSLLLVAPAAADNWPQWRGPAGDGTSRETDVPVSWSAEENVRWKTPLEGLGSSTPIVWGDRIFLTTQVGSGPSAGGNDFDDAAVARGAESDRVVFLLQAFAREDGRLLWERRFPASDELPSVHIKHNLASPSCVTDGERVYTWFGNGVAAATTLDGKLVWQRNLAAEHGAFDIRWGHGSSPVLHGESLYFLVDHPGHAYLLAADPATGETRWKRDRDPEKRSYTTPLVIHHDGREQLIVNDNDRIEGLDASTGEVLWHVGESNRVPVSTPVYRDGVLYSTRGYFSGPYLAVHVGGEGDVTDDLRWRKPTGAPYVSSLAYANGLVFMATERGIATAADAETGETVWKQRLGGVFTASPVVAGGNVYFVDEGGTTFVVAADREFRLVSENDLDERTLASPAISDGMLFLRTDRRLFAIE